MSAARFPERLRGFCSFNPLKEYALQELELCARDPNLRAGLKMHFGKSDVDTVGRELVKALGESPAVTSLSVERLKQTLAPYGEALLKHAEPLFERAAEAARRRVFHRAAC